MWSIRVLTGTQKGEIYDLKSGKNIFGRGPSCDLKIASVGISKEHCEVHVYNDKMIAVDLKSSNGTFVNGVKIQSAKISVGDKLSLFDVIMDIIPRPEARAQSRSNRSLTPRRKKDSEAPLSLVEKRNEIVPQLHSNGNAALQNLNAQAPIEFQDQSSLQLGIFENQESRGQALENQSSVGIALLTWSEKFDLVVENKIMPMVYKLASVLPYKNVILGFVLIYIFLVTLLSLFPLMTLNNEANLKEASRRAQSVARAMAKLNESNLLSGQFSSLNVNEALKEDGIKEAFIVQHSDGSIIAPPERAGRDGNRPFISQARREGRSTSGLIDAKTIGASHPIGVFDPTLGESQIKYHAIVYYNVGYLSADENRVVSLFMQTLIIASIIGLFVYFILLRLTLFPFRKLNEEIRLALRDKTDSTEINLDEPQIQNLVSQINFLLGRAHLSTLNSDEGATSHAPDQLNDLTNLVNIVSEAMTIISSENEFIAANQRMSEICQQPVDQIIGTKIEQLSDSALLQSIEEMMALATAAPTEIHSKKLHFSQFTCRISMQVLQRAYQNKNVYCVTFFKLDVQENST